MHWHILLESHWMVEPLQEHVWVELKVDSAVTPGRRGAEHVSAIVRRVTTVALGTLRRDSGRFIIRPVDRSSQ